MSQLYIRLKTGFYAHRKTLRLKAAIGNDAFWIPPRMWAYCAENQPDGDLSDYSPEEISTLIGFTGNAKAMLQALKSCGFLDQDSKVHDWQEHNGFHSFYSTRAKLAAQARWGKKEKNQKKEDKDMEKEKEREPSIAPCIASSNASSIETSLKPSKNPPSTSSLILREHELKRIEASLKSLRARKDSWTNDDKNRLAILKSREQELLSMLGMTA